MNGLSVNIPKDINEYREKIIFGLSLRQLLSIVVAAAVGGLVLLVCTQLFGMSIDDSTNIIVVTSIPIVAVGFVRKDNLPMEKYARLLLRHTIGRKTFIKETEYLTLEDENGYIDKSLERISKTAKRGRKGASDRAARVVTEKKRRSEARKRAREQIKAARHEWRAAVKAAAKGSAA